MNAELERKKAAEDARKNEIKARDLQARLDRKAKKKLEMGEEYQSSGQEEEMPDNVEAVPEGDLADPESLASRYQTYLKQKKKYEEENALSDDEIQQLDIKTRIQNELRHN
jgi:hypothetical protein